MYKFKFADIGEGLHEGVVAEIHVTVGQEVKEGESLFSVETDKVTSDIPSPVDGKVLEILMKVGETIHVGNDVMHFDAEGHEDTEEAAPEEKEEESAASVVGDIKVSNDLFSANMFAKPGAKVAPKQTVKATPAPKQTVAKDFDINSIVATGNGEKIDAIVIGSGPGGYTAGEFLGKLGLKTVVVENKKAGGVCLNLGCIPTKTLLKSAKIHHYIEEGEKYGIDGCGTAFKVNWDIMQARKAEVTAKLNKGVEMLLKGSKAELVYGEAEILDKHNVKVGDRTFTTKIIVIATGSSPVALPLDGFDAGRKAGQILDSSGALTLPSIPDSLAIIGGGVIGTEFASLYSELGTEVTILEGGPSILGPMDGEVKKLATKMMTDKGIKIRGNVKVKGFADGAVIFEEAGKEVKLKVDYLLESVGRRPNNMGLDKTIGLEIGKRGEIVVDKNMQTSIDNIFAIGDVVGHAMLAHIAYRHAHVMVDFIKGHKTSYNALQVPGCIYTTPEISMIGKTEEQLKEDGKPYLKGVFNNSFLGKALGDGETVGFTKLLIGKEHGEILGAHIVNTHSSDIIAEIAVAMKLESTIVELAETIHPHPSLSEGVYEAAVGLKEKFLAQKK